MESIFTTANQAPDLVPANESAIIVEPPRAVADTQVPAADSAAADQQFAQLLPKMSLEIHAALDKSLQKELASLRSFIGSTLDSHSERLQGDLATLLPPTRTPALDLPTVMPDRRPWGAIAGWSLAVLAIGGAAFMSWLWWNQGGELAAVRTDLAAAYSELETLRAKPEVVSVAPSVVEPVAVDPNAVVPAADAEGLPATAEAVELVPTNPASAPTTVSAPATAPVSAAPTATPPVNGAPPAPAPVAAAQPQTTQAQ